MVLCSLTLRPTDAEAPSGHTQAGLRPGNVQELHGTAYPTPVLATNDFPTPQNRIEHRRERTPAPARPFRASDRDADTL